MMKILMLALAISIFFLLSAPLYAGEDATNVVAVSIARMTINGTNAVEITFQYPTNLLSRSLQVSSDLGSTNNWRGVMLSEQVVPVVRSLVGGLPAWTRWTIKTDGVIGPRFYRLIGGSS